MIVQKYNIFLTLEIFSYLCDRKTESEAQSIQMNITIIANGTFPTLPPVLKQLGEADWVVCCDGALEKYLQWYRQQSPRPCQEVSVVGDGDSLSPALLHEAQHEGLAIDCQQIAEQEYNDLTKAVRHVNERCKKLGDGPINVNILGATGKREDHTLGNISLLAYYAEQFPALRMAMHSDYGTFYPVEGTRSFHSRQGQQVSLFALKPDTPVSAKGLKYPIENRRFRWLWEATLNEALSDSFEVQGDSVIVFINR